MITKFSDLDLNKTYSYADYLSWKFKERVELIKGRIFKMSPAPSSYHQEVEGNIFGAFWSYLRNSPCKVFSAPFDVRLPKPGTNIDDKILTVVQPDIAVLCDPSKIDRRGCLGAPDLIVEILSPSTADKDVHEKFNLYEGTGVQEYWIVHPEEQTLIVYLLNENGKYVGGSLLTRRDKVKVSIFDDFTLHLSEVFEERLTDY